jgi:hypothetical protein
MSSAIEGGSADSTIITLDFTSWSLAESDLGLATLRRVGSRLPCVLPNLRLQLPQAAALFAV